MKKYERKNGDDLCGKGGGGKSRIEREMKEIEEEEKKRGSEKDREGKGR